MGNVDTDKLIKYQRTIETMAACANNDIEISIYLGINRGKVFLDKHLKTRKEICKQYFITYNEEQKQYLIKMFEDINKMIAAQIGIII